MIFFLSSSTPETTTPTQRVELSPEQFAAIGDQINGAAFYVGGLLGIAVLCLGGIVMILAVGGR